MNNQQNNIQSNMTSEQTAKNYANSLGLDFVKLKDKKISSAVINIIPKRVAEQHKIIAYDFTDKPQKNLKIAVANPEKLKQKAPDIIINLKKKKGINIHLAITTADDFNWALQFYTKPTIIKHIKPVVEPVKKVEPKKEEKKEFIKVPYLRSLPEKLDKPLKIEEGVKTPLPDKPQETHKVIDRDKKLTLDETSITKPNAVKQISLFGQKIPFVVLSKFPKEVAVKHKMVVFAAPVNKKLIKVGLVDPDDEKNKQILDFISKKSKIEIETYKISENDFNYMISLYNTGGILSKKEEKLDDKKETTGIPSIKPLTKEETKELPPLKKPQEEKEPKKEEEERETIETEEAEKTKETDKSSDEILTKSEEETNLDVLLPNGIKVKENLSEIVKGKMVPKIVAGIIYFAVEQEASDIHLEPSNKDLRLRYRIDGILQDILIMPIELHPPITSRIKIMSKMRIDEQRIPQDGRISVECTHKEIDIRVSSMPTVHGEKIVMRLLDKSAGIKDIKELGIQDSNLECLLENVKKPYGIIFVTGPTGCGKTTTLYSMLKDLNKEEVNIVTFEDPVEYEINGINQSQVKPKIGFTFADGLRSVLRQDPNIIMVGEVRDSETAGMVVHAALTGHLVLSTLHTNTASGAMPRLINMGVEPFLITSAVNCIIAQRLVRRLCPKCKQKFQPPQPILEKIRKTMDQGKNQEVLQCKGQKLIFYKPKGCSYCKDGYKGRIGLFEILPMSAKIEDLSVRKQSADAIEAQAIAEGMITLRQDGIIKALQGSTSLDEVFKETGE